MSRRPNKEEAAHLQYETEHARPSAAKSVLPYMVILVAVAFILLIIAYFMQLRTAESVEGLNQSANSFRTIDQLVEENRTLRDQAAQLQEELDRAEADRDALKTQLAGAQEELRAAQEQLAQLAPSEESPAPSPAA